MFEFIPPQLMIFLISMLPIAELRVSIPVGLGIPIPVLGIHVGYNLPLWQVFPIAVIGNIFPVPFILIFFAYVEIFLRKYPKFNRFLTALFDRTRRRANSKIEKYETLGLMIFVAIPLPFTGAWTGALIAYIFGLKKSHAFISISTGVIIAGLIVTAICITGKALWLL